RSTDSTLFPYTTLFRSGVFGKIYYTLGFHDMYNSWWFIGLIAMLGTSILIASVDRVIPLYKSLNQQKTKRHVSFLKRQRIFGEGDRKSTRLNYSHVSIS